jgi:hypothetical protein
MNRASAPLPYRLVEYPLNRRAPGRQALQREELPALDLQLGVKLLDIRIDRIPADEDALL